MIMQIIILVSDMTHHNTMMGVLVEIMMLLVISNLPILSYHVYNGDTNSSPQYIADLPKNSRVEGGVRKEHNVTTTATTLFTKVMVNMVT